MAKSLTIDGREFGAVPIDLLAERLAGVRSTERSDVWLHDSTGPSLYVLKSGARAFLMFLRCEGDVGLTSRATDDRDHRELEFTLSNGQVDRYPASWTVPFDDAVRAAEYFWFKAEPAPFVSWRDDAD